MRAISVPPVPYHATAVRPDWADLPHPLRTAVADRLGAPVVAAVTAGGGFTRGYAGVLSTAAGDRVFVKVADLGDQWHVADQYAREAAITAALPPGLPVARPRWTQTVAGHFVLCLDAVAGRIPQLPWAPAELDAVLAGYAAVAAALREPPPALAALGLPTLSDLARHSLTRWQELAAARRLPPGLLAAGPAAARPPAPGELAAGDPSATAGPAAGEPDSAAFRDGTADPARMVRRRLPELAALEASLPAYAHHPGMIHGDLRVDNVLVDPAGTVWFCDWTWTCAGPAWFDLASLLVTGYASGLDADALFAAQPAGRDAPPDGLDAALAALCGHWLTLAAAEAGSASPHIQAHQRFSGETALAWLAHRRGWG